MLIAQRRRHILEEVRGRGYASFRELAATLGTSESTIRRDLRSLVADGLVVLTRGGVGTPESLHPIAGARSATSHEQREAQGRREPAHQAGLASPPRSGPRVAPESPPPMLPGQNGEGADDSEREAIATHAAAMVEPGTAVLLGPGRTTYALARRLVTIPSLTVVTTSVPVILALLGAPQVEVVIVGGTLRRSIQAFVGPLTEQSLHGLRGVQVFLSGDGVTSERGLTTHNVFAAATDQALVAAAKRVIVLADHTKVGGEAMCQTVPTERIDVLITDAAADPTELARITEKQVDVQIVHR